MPDIPEKTADLLFAALLTGSTDGGVLPMSGTITIHGGVFEC